MVQRGKIKQKNVKKLNLKLGGIKEMLTREQMKKVVGGYVGDGGSGKSCNIRCTDTGSSSSINSCSAADAHDKCGDDLSHAVCVCA